MTIEGKAVEPVGFVRTRKREGGKETLSQITHHPGSVSSGCGAVGGVSGNKRERQSGCSTGDWQQFSLAQ